VLRGQGEDQGVSGTSVVADLIVLERAFEQKAGALGDPHAGMIAGVAPDLDAFGVEGVESEAVMPSTASVM
jgi:hypothetical protein